MLRDANTQGFVDALARFGIKEAGVSDWARDAWEGVKDSPRLMWEGISGSPEVRKQIVKGKAFAPGGALHLPNVLWPTTGGTVGKWLGRAGTILPALEAYSALRGRTGDPHEGRLTNALGSVGRAVGNAYGFPALGMIGGGVLGGIGQRLGVGLGRVLGSKPEKEETVQLPPPYIYYPQHYPGAPQ